MRFLLLLSLLPALIACSTSQSTIVIPAQERIVFSYPAIEVVEATLTNKSNSTIQVAVRNDTAQVRGFGLAKKAKATILVEAENQLVIRNESKSDVQVKIATAAKDQSTFKSEGEYINFTLRNNTATSIPLIIPSVMNPNLSPFSNSGVSLKIGQEILFKENGKRYVLLTVENTIQDGDIIDVGKRLKERKKVLGL